MSGERIKGRKVGVGTSSSSSSASVMFPFFTNMYSSATKAEQILSRYRPIAPKPPSAPKPDAADSSAAAAPAASAAAPAVQSSSSASIGCRKGTRKRAPGENLISPRSYKRSAGNSRKSQQQPQQPQQQESKQQQMVPVMGAEMGVEMGVSLSSTVTTSVSEAPAAASTRALREPVWKVLRRNPNPETSYEILSNSRSLSSSEFLYPSGNVQISSQASPSPSHLQQQQQQQQQQQRDPVSIVKAEQQQQQHRNPLPIVKAEQEQQQQEQEEDQGEEEEDRPKLVTLSLLPDTPAQVAESCTISTSDLRLRLRDENQLELSLFSGAASCSAPPRYSSGEGCAPPRYAAEQQQQMPDFKQQHAGLIDSGYLEQAHGGSSDPVVLTSEGSSSSVLWSNLSYNKVMSERMSGKRAAGPYIDPLGLPTQLGCFRFRPRGTGSECSAVLWGFLKKFMLLDSNPQHAAGNMSGNSGEVVEQSSVFQHHNQYQQQQQQRSSDQHLQKNCDQRQQQQQVIVPQPRRPCGVGSAVCLEMVSEMNCYSGCLTGCLESVESQLERTSSPAFVTDRSNRVRWVNGAYHRLVGSQHQPQPQPQQQREQRPNGHQHHQVGTMNVNCTTEESANSSSSACMADRDVVFQWERSPYSAVSLAGLARVDWLDCGKRCCLTGVPCEMRRLDDPRFGSLFVWKLSLNVNNVIRNRG